MCIGPESTARPDATVMVDPYERDRSVINERDKAQASHGWLLVGLDLQPIEPRLLGTIDDGIGPQSCARSNGVGSIADHEFQLVARPEFEATIPRLNHYDPRGSTFPKLDDRRRQPVAVGRFIRHDDRAVTQDDRDPRSRTTIRNRRPLLQGGSW